MKKLIVSLLCLAMLFSLAACGSAPAKEKDSFTVGICQLAPHVALDAATQGFKDALTEALGDKVTFVEHNAAGDSATCSTICNQLAAENVDLIMANATPALLAAAAATSTIPILGTSVTHYGTALGIDDWKGYTGTNISGTSDLSPMDEQANMIADLFPDAKNVGVLFCSAEPNSVFQADTIEPLLTAKGFTVTRFTFADSNDVATVTANACAASDILYIPTDNTAATCAETINNVCQPAGVPVFCGEAGLCSGCGAFTLSIDYYDLGIATGKMALQILTEGADVSTMEIGFAPDPQKQYNAPLCAALGLDIPADYVAIG